MASDCAAAAEVGEVSTPGVPPGFAPSAAIFSGGVVFTIGGVAFAARLAIADAAEVVLTGGVNSPLCMALTLEG